MGETKHQGTAVEIGGTMWIVPPLTLGQLKRLTAAFARLGAIGPRMSEEDIEAVVDIAYAAFSRNYPDLGRDTLEEMIDLGNAGRVIQAIVGISGLQSAGEAKAGSASTPSTGTN